MATLRTTEVIQMWRSRKPILSTEPNEFLRVVCEKWREHHGGVFLRPPKYRLI